MSFSSETKKELSKLEQGKKCCTLAEISGFVRMNGSIRLKGGGRINVFITSEDPSIARHFKSVIQSYFDTTTSLDVTAEMALRKGKTYRITLDEDIMGERMLREIGLLTIKEGNNVFVDGIPQEIIKKKCCKRAYLRGIFMASGSINNPEKGYHFEIVCKDRFIADDVVKLLGSLKISAKSMTRRDQFVVYVKEGESIADILRLTGAHSQLMEFENIRVLRDMRNKVNRIVNCESANLDKSVNAAGRHIENIQTIDKFIGLNNLPEKLRAAAKVRLENPYASIKELAENMDPPISKGGMNHRLEKIDEIAERLRLGEK